MFFATLAEGFCSSSEWLCWPVPSSGLGWSLGGALNPTPNYREQLASFSSVSLWPWIWRVIYSCSLLFLPHTSFFSTLLPFLLFFDIGFHPFLFFSCFHFSSPYLPVPILCPQGYVTQQPHDPGDYSVSLNLNFFICKMEIIACISWGCEKDSIVMCLIDPRDGGYAEQNRAKS